MGLICLVKIRKKALVPVAAALVAGLLVTGCSAGGGGQPAAAAGIGLDPEGPSYDVDLDQDVVAALNRMGLNVYLKLLASQAGADGEAVGGNGGDNGGTRGGGATGPDSPAGDGGIAVDGDDVFIAPASIALALAMTYNGARGETKAAMAEALSLVGLDLDAVNASYYILIKELSAAADPKAGVQLRLANGIWQRQGIDFYEDFLTRNRQFYGAAIETADFDDPATINTINQWIGDQTEGRIVDLLQEIRPDSVMFLINALYFKGDWTTPFDPERTRLAPFYLGGGGLPGIGSRPASSPTPAAHEREVAMMYQEGDFSHYKGDSFQAVRLPYGKDGRLAMYVFLPDDDSDLAAFHDALTYEDWQEWQGGFSEKHGLVALPRFQLTYKEKLDDSLKAMGMAVAFDRNRADFGGMRPVTPGNNLYIGEVLHQTFLQVNEEGAEAAGATSVEIRLESALLPDFEFVADRPFFVTIQDDATGVLLFAGAVTNPQPVE